ncbi:SDR family NAD(P)-dependent oxidoreductase [Nocardia sp. SSK8]|uniref:SDR family NAD(P)-dependent oxidoreductase n=1 Tax=Nocardia sp. SSK8 TaxID=3120154 RepID=UPI0030080B9A
MSRRRQHSVARLLDALADQAVNPPRSRDLRLLHRAVSGKKVLITGASYGLGEATARLFARHGATVVLVARSEDRLHEVAEAIRGDGGSALVYRCDLTDPVQAGALGRRITEEHGALDIIVSNAGKSIRRSLHLQYERPQDFTRTIGVNYLGPVCLLLELLPAMRAAGRGHLVNISTVGVRMAPAPRWGAYQASKGAFDTWFRSVAPELSTDGVTTSSLYMALLHTRMSAPTPGMRDRRGLTAEQGAQIVAKAVIERSRVLAPPWLLPVELVSTALAGATQRRHRRAYESSADSPSARGETGGHRAVE